MQFGEISKVSLHKKSQREGSRQFEVFAFKGYTFGQTKGSRQRVSLHFRRRADKRREDKISNELSINVQPNWSEQTSLKEWVPTAFWDNSQLLFWFSKTIAQNSGVMKSQLFPPIATRCFTQRSFNFFVVFKFQRLRRLQRNQNQLRPCKIQDKMVTEMNNLRKTDFRIQSLKFRLIIPVLAESELPHPPLMENQNIGKEVFGFFDLLKFFFFWKRVFTLTICELLPNKNVDSFLIFSCFSRNFYPGFN